MGKFCINPPYSAFFPQFSQLKTMVLKPQTVCRAVCKPHTRPVNLTHDSFLMIQQPDRLLLPAVTDKSDWVGWIKVFCSRKNVVAMVLYADSYSKQ
ncbi:hypothetical protein CEXT_136361 [Caerostris extrusa]|uniref:Uncharacterized protein n=1 Tax=Caerostris extrusa TaxID=172846 RepID=A0AAV4U288_CAEEX|nr:hypothetical protein CEXT_136361 [Caerostris extrusa]